MSDIDRIEFWREIEKGAVLSLSDSQSLSGCENPHGMEYTVVSKKIVGIQGESDEPIAEYIILGVQEGSEIDYLVVVSTGDNFLTRLYYTPEAVIDGSRADLIDEGDIWMFLPPEDVDNYTPSSLELASFITPPLESGGTEYHMSGFNQTLFGTIQGEVDVACQITEYETEETTGNPYILILEEGYLDFTSGDPLEDGGYMTVFKGCDIDLSEIKEVL